MIDWADEVKPRTTHTGRPGMNRLLIATRKGDLLSVKQALQETPSLITEFSEGHNRSLVWEAVRAGRIEILEYLLERNAPINIPGRIRSQIQVLLPPLCIAMRYRKKEIEGILRAAGAVEDFYTHCFLGHHEQVLDLLDHKPDLLNTEVEFESVWCVTAFHYAVAGRQLELVDDLVKHGAVVRPYTRLLLNIAARQKGDAMYERLVNAGIDQNLTSQWYRHQV